MIAYYVHWHYPSSADDALYYSGEDDEKLFHKSENAESYAKTKLNEWYKDEDYFGDIPNDYTILKREIKFEDE